MAGVAKARTRSGIYGGRSTEQRQAERRRKLIDAALEIWQEQGWAAVSMRAVCTRAGLIDRYFYENFPDRDALLGAAWDQVRDQTTQMLLAAIANQFDQPPLTQLRTAITAFVRHLTENPRQGQMFFGDHAGNPVLEQRRRDTLQTYTDLLIQLARPYLKPGTDETTFRMTVLIGIGGFNELIAAWHAGIITADADQIIDQAACVGTTLGTQYLADNPPHT